MVFLKIFKKHSDPDASSFTNTVSYSVTPHHDVSA